jgi:hypothetical protein
MYFHRKESTNEPEGRAVFYSPFMTGHKVNIVSEVKTGNILNLEPMTNAIYENEVINGTQQGRAYNG